MAETALVDFGVHRSEEEVLQYGVIIRIVGVAVIVWEEVDHFFFSQ